MSIHDNSEADANTVEGIELDLARSIEASQRVNEELSFLFGEEVVEQVNHIDIADLNLNKDILESIASGVRQLKQLKSSPNAQLDLVNAMEPGARIVLCLWIMDMDLLNKIQSRSYLD